jgi:GntR family transcriptional repressor for pyruvate dehydrogenase complex
MPASRPPPASGPAPSVQAFQPIRSARAFEEIAAQIRAELAAGRLKVGSRLPSERALSEQFGVSRNTLREALRSLEHAGLIRLQKGASGGAFISERSGDAVITGLLDLYHVGAIGPAQLTQARIWLESVIVREACQRATADDLLELQRNIDEAEAAHARGDFEERVARHLDFHRILARMAGNPIMMLMMDGILVVLRHFVQTIGEHHNPYTLPSRRRFLKHMEEGDVAAAVAEMESSLKRLELAYLSRYEAARPRSPMSADGVRRSSVRKVAARR